MCNGRLDKMVRWWKSIDSIFLDFHLEFGNAIWHPCYVADIRKVEGVQHTATKIIPELRDKPYHERLQSLKLYSMEYRRRRVDMIQTYKILKDIDRIDSNAFLLKLNRKGQEVIA